MSDPVGRMSDPVGRMSESADADSVVANAKRMRLDTLLRDAVSADGLLLVAYSGGVDSAYLAWAAHQALGVRMRAVIADSPSLPRKELAAAIAFAAEHGIALDVVSTDELGDEKYVRNDAMRCFHCKDELFRVMSRFAAERGVKSRGAVRLAYGRNVDDRGDFRPGQQAAEQYAVLSPLADAGLGKQEIRLLARQAGLTLWEKPASACLASRIEYKREVSAPLLAQVEAAEESLHELGFRQVRVRHHGEMARVEIERAEMERALSLAMLERITAGVKAAGFKYVALDTSGYRSGSMNAVIPVETLLQHARA
jgi:uncharacterized protein